MRSDGAVMRLGKEDFKKLLNEPMLDWVSMAEAEEIIRAGGQWLDVRLPSEFENQHLDKALNIPLYFIRLKINTLDEKEVHRVLRYGTPQLGRRLHPERTWLPGVRAARRYQPRSELGDFYMVWVGLSPPSAPAR